MPKEKINIADIIRQARKLKGTSQLELASKLGLGQTSIAHIESGRNSPSVDTLSKIAEALDLELVIEFREKPF